MKKLIVLCATALMSLLLVASVVGCQQQAPDVIETIRIFKAGPPGSPPPTGGWALQASEPHPTEIQEVFNPGDRMYLGLAIGKRLVSEVTFSRFTFFNRVTGVEDKVYPAPDDFGPFEPGQTFLLAFQEPWKVPDEDGEYELRVYMGNDMVASALFNIGIRPASWGPEMEIYPAPIHEVRVFFEGTQAWAYIKAGLPDICSEFYGGDSQFTDNTVYINLDIQRPKGAACAQVYSYFEEYWAIGGDHYVSGETYTVDVNGYTTTFVMP